MKITFLLLFCSLVNLIASPTYSQNTKISLSLKNATIEEVLNKIEDESEFYFLFNQKLVNVQQKVDIEADNEPIKDILDEILTKDIKYVVLDRQIILTPETKSERTAIPPQQKQITGIITDETGSALPGVNIMIEGTTIGVLSNSNGEYSISVPNENVVLVFSFIGFQVQKVSTEGRASISPRLISSNTLLDEVIVTGYGTTKKATLTGSVVAIKGAEIMRSPVTNVTNRLAGTVPGLLSVQTRGEPGRDGSTLRIRGISTFGDATPLVIVDGIPGRSLERIDAESIESISVLKDASAAIYGSRAANGVILVTTKRGQAGTAVVTLNLQAGVGQPSRIPRMCDAAEYATLLNEVKLANYSSEEIEKFSNGSDPWRYPNSDWLNEVIKPWSAQNRISLEMSGGSQNLTYFLLLGKSRQDGFYKNSATFYNQYDIRSQISGKISKDITINFDLSGRGEDRNFAPTESDNIFYYTLRSKPTSPAYWPDGKPGPDIELGNQPVLMTTDAAGYNRTKGYILNSNLSLEIKVPWIKGLNVTGKAAIDKTYTVNKLWRLPLYVYTWDGKTVDANNIPVTVKTQKGVANPRLTENWTDALNLYLMGLLDYRRTFESHSISASAGIERITGNGDNAYAYRETYLTDAIDQLFAGGEDKWQNSGSGYEEARLSYFGRINYNFKEKYLLEVVGRYDGSYIFPEDKRFGFFPGISAGWRVSEEAFWANNIIFIDNLKLRASYGKTGNDRISPYQFLASYGFRSGSFITGSTVKQKALYETKVPNENITWEVANQADIGVDIGMFKGKLAIEFDYFNYLRTGLLWTRNATVPATAGFTLPRENIGETSNKGFDFSILYNNNIGGFTYSIGINGLYARNEVVYMDEPPGATEWQTATGKPIPEDLYNYQSNLYYVAAGIFKDQTEIDATPHWTGAVPGDVIFKDVNGDKIIDAQDRIYREKSFYPTTTGALNISLGYKGFDFLLLLQGSAGADKYISWEGGDYANYLKDFYDNRWTSDNNVATQPRTISRTAAYWKANRNTYFLMNNDYLRIKNLEIGYNLPEKVLQKIKTQNLRIYINGYNLWTYTPHMKKDYDPEPNVAWGAGYPIQRVISGGLSVTF